MICTPVIVINAIFNRYSTRYLILPIIIESVSIICETALVFKIFFPRRWKYIFVAGIILTCIYCLYDLLDLDSYRYVIQDFSDTIIREAANDSSPLILTFDKQALRYHYFSKLPVKSAYHIGLGNQNDKLPTYLSMFAKDYDSVYVIWEMKEGEKYQEPSNNTAFFPGNGEWRKLIESYTSRRKTKKRFLYHYTFSDEIRSNLSNYAQRNALEHVPNGEMERSAKTPTPFVAILGKERNIPFFQKQNQFYPSGITLWTNRNWLPGCNGKIYISKDNPISGTASLFCSAESPIQWMINQWIPANAATISFSVRGTKDTNFQLVVQGRSEKTFLSWTFPVDGSYQCDGKVQHFDFMLTESFLLPAKEFRVGISLLQGECSFDQFSCKTYFVDNI